MHASPREETKRGQHYENERRRDRSNSSNNRMNHSNKRGSNRSISRDEKEEIDETFYSRKKSRMSATLLSNFVLGITLLKNISLRFSTPGKFYDEFDQSMSQLMHVEKILY